MARSTRLELELNDKLLLRTLMGTKEIRRARIGIVARNYKKEYENYHSSAKAKRQRARNNKANRQAGTYGNGDGKDIAHSKPGARGKVVGKQSPSKNRAFPRTKSAKRAS